MQESGRVDCAFEGGIEECGRVGVHDKGGAPEGVPDVHVLRGADSASEPAVVVGDDGSAESLRLLRAQGGGADGSGEYDGGGNV